MEKCEATNNAARRGLGVKLTSIRINPLHLSGPAIICRALCSSLLLRPLLTIVFAANINTCAYAAISYRHFYCCLLGYLLEADQMKGFWDYYLEKDTDGSDPLASPLRFALRILLVCDFFYKHSV